ncbi:MAG: OsmC family protein [Flavobacteriales bacterium]
MAHEIEAVWMGKMQFNALVGGHTVIMDAPDRAGGEDQGPIPKPFMLTALAGCTGMDVVALLRNAGKSLERFDVRVTGEITKTHPIQYSSVHVIYEMHGDAAHEEEALRMVARSQNELCGVSAMIKRALPVTWEVHYNGIECFNNKEAEVSIKLIGSGLNQPSHFTTT